LDDVWTAAFRALGKAPTGWLAFIPANFGVGILMIWFYARLQSHYGGGPISALRSGLATWAVFWVIPMMSIMPMNLFPNRLLATVIALGFVDVNLAALFHNDAFAIPFQSDTTWINGRHAAPNPRVTRKWSLPVLRPENSLLAYRYAYRSFSSMLFS
jgi:hypothetical protein